MISFIIPAYNEQNYIENTLKKIPKDSEVIIVCNGCTDNTYKIARKCTKKVYNIDKKNVSLARNYGAKKAKNNILVFLDADTIVNKNFINKILSIKDKNFFGTCKVYPDNNHILAHLYCFIKNLIGLLGIHNSSGIIFSSKKLFNKVKFNENLIKRENQDFSVRAKQYGKRYFLSCYTITSMRRFEKIGYLNVPLYWLKEIFHESKDYPNVR